MKNKGIHLLLVTSAILAVLSATGEWIKGSSRNQPGYASTPNIPHCSHRRRDMAKPPNDGRWHMKFHRSRV